MKDSLLIDLGGTNIRHAFLIDNVLSKPVKKKIEDKDFYSYLSELISDIDKNIVNLVIAAAGPNIQHSINLTNRNLVIDAKELEDKLKIHKCHLLNDWEAVGYSLKELNSNSFQILKNGSPKNENYLLIGPGTGLGLTLILNNQVIPTELGNTLSGSSNLLKNFKLSENDSFNTIEDVLSGPGLEKLYKVKYKETKSAEDIVNFALSGEEKEKFIVEAFLKSLTQIINDLILSFSLENIILGGSILNSLESFLLNEKFINYFLSEINPKYSFLADRAEIKLIKESEPGIYGCLAFLKKAG